MQSQSELERSDSRLSTKDICLIAVIAPCGLLCFALSFTLLQDNGRPYLFCGSLAVFLVCLLFADKKRDILGGMVVFIMLRVVWSIMTTSLRIL